MGKKPKLPKRTDGGCIPFLNGIVCKTTTTGLLKSRHMKMIGRGLVTIPAHMANVITKYIEELPHDCMLVYQDEIKDLITNQICSWCDGHGWQPVNAMENVVACSNCGGDGLEPEKTRPKLSKLTPEARERMGQVVVWRKQGMTFAEIGSKLKITRERVRQIQHLAKTRRIYCP